MNKFFFFKCRKSKATGKKDTAKAVPLRVTAKKPSLAALQARQTNIQTTPHTDKQTSKHPMD